MSAAAQPISASASIEQKFQTKAFIAEHLRSKHVPASEDWLQGFMAGARMNASLLAIQNTAYFRILASDITVSMEISQSPTLPPDVAQPENRERRLTGPFTVQVLDIEDIGHSRWNQIEAIDAQERGEMTKGREVIRVVPEGNSTADSPVTSSGPHKLLLQDCRGTKLHAVELEHIKGVGIGLSIGSKMVLRGLLVARGVALLQSSSVELLGGKIDLWDRQWRSERKESLRSKAGISVAGE